MTETEGEALGAPGFSPQEFFGRELARRREAAGLTQAELGQLLKISGQMISHFEAGRRRPRIEDAERIDQALGTDGFFTRWRIELEEGRFADHFAAAYELEKLATSLRLFGPTLVPGLLQTAPYAAAVFEAYSVNYTTEDVERRVRNRIDRSLILSDPEGPQVWALLDESVIRRRVGGGTVMAEQLRHIVALARGGRIRVQVLPFTSGAHALMESMVHLMRFKDCPPIAYVEGLHTGRVLDDPEVIEDCRTSYDLALSEALPVEDSLTLLEKAAKEHERHDQQA
ncbi:helix-turn-helix domain-containing protein [Streptomyces sp. NPDC101490]|uniref:helix-turn-helix domain-containing protein n=1 Tax=Streptomyces sp. NPDC101490 TaxID=3366143 RepID=UPI00380F4D50